jgi:DNA-binding transcriptional LysR family regulator
VFLPAPISVAAKRLKVTQSAVSNALARLRRSLGDEFFVRTLEAMRPMPFAERMGEPVGAAPAQLGNAFKPAEDFDPFASRGRLTIAMTDVGETCFMPRQIKACAVQAPRLDIASVRAGLIDLRAEMAAGRVDLAIGVFEDAPTVFYQRLFQQAYFSMFRREHPLGDDLSTSSDSALPAIDRDFDRKAPTTASMKRWQSPASH